MVEAISTVPREAFVRDRELELAWENGPLPIGLGQTISQPVLVARMCELLRTSGNEVALDVGGGSGYHAAVLSRLVRKVISIERHADLVDQARLALDSIGVANVEVVHGDGSRGFPPQAPYNVINVAAAVHGEIPGPLFAQLAEGGRMVVPVGRQQQWLELISKQNGDLKRRRVEPVAFVPLVEG